MLENDVGRYQVLDVIPKKENILQDVLDLKVSSYGDKYLFMLEKV